MIENEGIMQEGGGIRGAYRAFLLRCWQETEAGVEGNSAWRFILVQLGDKGKKKGFACLEELMVYLRDELDMDPIQYGPSK